MNSILKTIKKLLGIDEEYEHFDQDLIIYINSAISTLRQLGVGSAEGYSILGDQETWNDYLGVGLILLDVQTYIYYKVRLSFDPPSSSYLLDAIERQIKELEWRLYVQAEALI